MVAASTFFRFYEATRTRSLGSLYGEPLSTSPKMVTAVTAAFLYPS